MNNSNEVYSVVDQLQEAIKGLTLSLNEELQEQHSLNPSQFRSTPYIYKVAKSTLDRGSNQMDDPEDSPWRGEWDNTDDGPND